MLGGSEAARQLRGQAQDARGERSLLNTFPFNQQRAEAGAELQKAAPVARIQAQVDNLVKWFIQIVYLHLLFAYNHIYLHDFSINQRFISRLLTTVEPDRDPAMLM